MITAFWLNVIDVKGSIACFNFFFLGKIKFEIILN